MKHLKVAAFLSVAIVAVGVFAPMSGEAKAWPGFAHGMSWRMSALQSTLLYVGINYGIKTGC